MFPLVVANSSNLGRFAALAASQSKQARGFGIPTPICRCAPTAKVSSIVSKEASTFLVEVLASFRLTSIPPSH